MPVQLINFLKQLAGHTVDIELKNGSVVQGEVVAVDANMNTHLKKVRMTAKRGSPTQLEQLTIRGATIRHYNLPSTVNVEALLAKCSELPAPRK